MHAHIIDAAARLSNQDLRSRLADLAFRERRATVVLIAHLAEFDRRKLYREEGYGSLFSYCTEELRLSEHAAFNRIEAARAGRSFPWVLELLAEGAVNLSTLRLLAPHLTPENHEVLLAEARGRSKREVEVIVARLAPQPDVRATVRKLPAPVLVRGPERADVAEAACAREASNGTPVAGPAVVPAAAETIPPAAVPPPPAKRTVVAPLTPERYRVQFTVTRETQEKLRRAQDLLRREIPDGDPAAIFDRALTLLLDDVARRKLAATPSPRPRRASDPRSRHIPAGVKRKVWVRDHGQCAFVSPAGRRCRERTLLEFHHVNPYALGGEATVENIALRCREHNAHESELLFGPWDPATVQEPRGSYSTWSGVDCRRHNELCPTRPGASWASRGAALETLHSLSP